MGGEGWDGVGGICAEGGSNWCWFGCIRESHRSAVISQDPPITMATNTMSIVRTHTHKHIHTYINILASVSINSQGGDKPQV